jgi:uncharacterized protein
MRDMILVLKESVDRKVGVPSGEAGRGQPADTIPERPNMPLFSILCHDRPDAGSLRADTRPRHLEYLERIGDALFLAGPMLGEDGAPKGSIVIVDMADLDSAKAFAATDPYAEAGLFESVTVTGFRKVLP